MVHEPPVSDIKPADILANVSAGTESTRGQIIERLVENGFLTRNLRLTTKGYIVQGGELALSTQDGHRPEQRAHHGRYREPCKEIPDEAAWCAELQ